MLWALLSLRRVTRRALRSSIKPDFAWLRKLTTYVERYPENIHQPNEDHLLFSPIATREPALARTIARLRRDHAAMKGYGNRLRGALACWEQGDPSASRLAAALAEDYARFCERHCRSERRELLPAAERLLANSEWLKVGQACEAAADLLATSRNDRERTVALMRMQ